MTGTSSHTRPRDRAANTGRPSFDARPGVITLSAHGCRAADEGSPRPQVPEKGSGGPDQSTEGELPRRWPGFRHQGAGLSGRLRFKSAPLRYYTRHDACQEASSQGLARSSAGGCAEDAGFRADRRWLPARLGPGDYEPVGREASCRFSTWSSIVQNIGRSSWRWLYRHAYSSR